MIFVFALVLLLALAMIPVGLPGTWVMIAAAIALGFASAAVHVGWVVIGGCVVIAIIAEALDVVLAARYTKRYGGSRRGAWGPHPERSEGSQSRINRDASLRSA